MRPFARVCYLIALVLAPLSGNAAPLRGWDVQSVLAASDGRVYAGDAQGILISDDKGATWKRASKGLHAGYGVTLAEASDGTVFAGGIVLYRSKGNTVAWTPSSPLPKDLEDTAMYISHIVWQGKDMYFTNDYGVFKSLDQGATWKNTWSTRELAEEQPTALVAARDGDMYAATYSGIYRSRDGGAKWTRTSKTFAEPVVQLRMVDKSLIAVALLNGLFKSADQGATWTAINRGLPPTGNRGKNPHTVFVASDGALYTGSGARIFKSLDKGGSWLEASKGVDMDERNYIGTDHMIMSFTEDRDGALYAGTKNGIFKSLDKGANWTRVLRLREPR